MSDDFNNLRFDPDAEKAAINDRDGLTGPRSSNGVLRDPPPRKSSAYDRARGSMTTLRNSISREPGWDKKKSLPLSNHKGSISEGEGEDIDYNTLEWWQAGFIMIAETVSLGILSLPSVLATIGMVPGIILIAGMGALATYSGYVIGQFRLRYPWVHSFGDAGEILGEPIKAGAVLRELFGWAQTIFQIFTMASHILTWTICFNTITDGATCTIVWGIVGLVIFWVLDLPRTLGKVSYMSICSFISILSAVFVTMIDVGVVKPIGSASLRALPPSGLSFTTAFLSVSNITFAFAGHSCFFGFIAEFRNPADWPKALTMLQVCCTSLYLVAAIVIYRYAGPNVESPALGSAGGVVKKVAWGIAIPTIIIAGVIYGHIAAKYCFVRLFRGTKHLTKRTKLSTTVWLVLTALVWVIAWIIAESIPNFNDLLGLVSALFASWFTYGIPGIFWLFMNWDDGTDELVTEHTHEKTGTKTQFGAKGWFKNWKKTTLFVANVTLFVVGVAICVLGLWSSGDAISNENGGNSWTCKSNAQ